MISLTSIYSILNLYSTPPDGKMESLLSIGKRAFIFKHREKPGITRKQNKNIMALNLTTANIQPQPS